MCGCQADTQLKFFPINASENDVKDTYIQCCKGRGFCIEGVPVVVPFEVFSIMIIKLKYNDNWPVLRN